MIARAKEWAKARWPRLRLRTILFATLFLVAALPGFGAVFLRVYENTLVRQTQAELVAEGAALAATAAALWPKPAPGRPMTAREATPAEIDLSTTPILEERAAPARSPPPSAAATSAAERLEPILAATRRATLASIVLLDAEGRVVAGSRRSGSLAALPEVRAALAGHATTTLRRAGAYRAVYRFEWLSRAAALRAHHAVPVIAQGRVVGVLLLSRSARALFRGLYEDRGKIILGVVAILVALVVLSGLISRGITRPIEQLGQATRAVASGHGSVPRVPPTAAIEIQGLYADFATMAAAIDRRSRYLRDVAHAVSHEFKTPLAAIRGAIELLQDHEDTMSAAERHRFLANADADAGRLAQLVSRLLELARADMGEAAPGAIAPLAPVLARIADAHRAHGFAVKVAGSDAVVALPAATVETVLATLVDNARQAGARAVSIAVDAGTDGVTVDVVDDGPGIAPGNRERLFEPFFTTRRSAGGTGLGLTIARSLLAAYGGGLALVEAEATTFRLTLPAGRATCSPAR